MAIGVRIVSADVQAMLRRIQAQISPAGMLKLFRRLANLQTRSTFDNFDEQSFDGDAWEALSETTLETGRSAENILHPTGEHLMRTISNEATPDYARVFTPTPWAHVHNEGAELEGTAFGDIVLPRRTFLGISEEDEANIVMCLEDFTEEMLV